MLAPGLTWDELCLSLEKDKWSKEKGFVNAVIYNDFGDIRVWIMYRGGGIPTRMFMHQIGTPVPDVSLWLTLPPGPSRDDFATIVRTQARKHFRC